MKNYFEKTNLLTTIVIVFSIVSVTLVFLPIYSEVDSGFVTLLLTIVNCIIIIYVSFLVKDKINDFINKAVERERTKHINEFYDYFENKPIYSEVLRRDTPIINDKGEEIGTQTIYSVFSKMRYNYYNYYKNIG